MRPIHRQVCSAVALLLWTAAPAAAQDPKRAEDIGREIEAQIEQHIELGSRQFEHFVNHHLDDILDDVLDDVFDEVHRALDKQAGKVQQKVQQKVVLAAQRQGAEAARREAQRAREAERQRRDESRRGPEFTEKVSKTLRLGRNGTFDLQNISGQIVVTGGAGNDVRVDATKRVRHPNESEARQLLQAIDVQIVDRNGSVEVRTDYPRRNWSGGVDYTVAVPRDANVILRSVSGDIRVSNLNGDLRAETASGDIAASAVRRLRQAKTFSGDLEIADSDSDDLVGSTISGTIVARALKARSVDLQSVSGDVRMTDVESDRTFVRSVSGTVDFSGRLATTGRYEFQSHSGDVRVAPVGASGFSIEASTFNGDLRSDFPLTLQGNPPNSFTRRNTRGIRGSFGQGGAVLTVQSFSGNITIVKR
jgi:putative adhesin